MLHVQLGSLTLCGAAMEVSPYTDVSDQPRNWRLDAKPVHSLQPWVGSVVPEFLSQSGQLVELSFEVSRSHASVDAAEKFMLDLIESVKGVHTLTIKVFVPGDNPASATPKKTSTWAQAICLARPMAYEGILTHHVFQILAASAPTT